MGIDTGQRFAAANPRANIERDNAIEKLITKRNKHSVYHICPKHGHGIYLPMSNDCPDCRLFLGSDDIRTLLDEEKFKLEDLLGMIKMNASEMEDGPDGHKGHFISNEDWERIMDKHDPIRINQRSE